ncbi:MAG: DNA-3-methyladenine glycosylase I [Tatlockia sp.]|jgi:DNA-3-methyladenine glycosylase I
MISTRCAWVNDNPLYIDYHDKEWGVPVYDERLLFEFLILEGMQAGLNWLTILKKRDHFRKDFANFEAERIALFDQNTLTQLMSNAGIIRNRLKIQAAIGNAQAFLRIRKNQGDFSHYIWSFVQGEPVQNHWNQANQVPTTTFISDAMAKDLKKRGFKFTGSTICYAFMQATGMVNDHTVNCFRYNKAK